MNQEKQPLFIIKNDFEFILLILISLLVGYGLFELIFLLHSKFNMLDESFLIIVLPCLVLAEILMIGLIVESRDRSRSKNPKDDNHTD